MSSGTQAGPDDLVFLPLGGAGEIGMNLSLYGHGGSWLAVDMGLAFANDTVPGVDLLVPDASFLEEQQDNLVGIVLTHGHEDHIGALPFLWPRLRCSVYATPFTAELVRAKLDEAGLLDEVPLNVVPLGGRIDLAPFTVTYIGVTHSIPEPNALAIDTPHGTVVHSGDWKIDPKPLVGETIDETALTAVGNKGVKALICDSTNVFRSSESGSEAAVRASLIDLVKARTGRVAITTFASNVARLETAHAVAEATDRHLVVVGRSMWRTIVAAQATGHLDPEMRVLTERDFGYLPPDKVLLLCTGSQGEPRGAMARIAGGVHSQVVLEAGDTVIFSSKIIPGNERTIGRLHNALALADVEIISERDAFVHVSGHPGREELATLYSWLKPEILVPVHGEVLHLKAQAGFAESCGIGRTAIAVNGEVLKLAPGAPHIIDQVDRGRLAVDGFDLVALDSELIRRRRRLAHNGCAAVALAVDGRGLLARPPLVSLAGAFSDEDDPDVLASLEAAVAKAWNDLPTAQRNNDEKAETLVGQALRREVRRLSGRRPTTEVQILRLEPTEPRGAKKRKEAVQ